MPTPPRRRWFAFAFVLVLAFAFLGVVVFVLGSVWFLGVRARLLGEPEADQITAVNKVDQTAEEMAGREILLASDKAYAALRSYVGIIDLTSSATYPNGLIFPETRRVKVLFQRPGKLRLETLDSNGNPLEIVADGDEVGSMWKMGPAGWRQDKFASAKDALNTYAGITLGATRVLPSVLMQTEWNRETFFDPQGRLLPAFATAARLDGEEDVNGYPCHRVVCVRTIGTWTFYIDKESQLLRRVDEDESPAQMAEQRALGGGGASGAISGSHISQVFEIQEMDSDIPSKPLDSPGQ